VESSIRSILDLCLNFFQEKWRRRLKEEGNNMLVSKKNVRNGNPEIY